MTTIAKVWAQYAQAIGQDVESLTDAQKKQAFLAAVLDGQRVEPFATYCDLGDAALKEISPGVQTLQDHIRKMQK